MILCGGNSPQEVCSEIKAKKAIHIWMMWTGHRLDLRECLSTNQDTNDLGRKAEDRTRMKLGQSDDVLMCDVLERALSRLLEKVLPGNKDMNDCGGNRGQDLLA